MTNEAVTLDGLRERMEQSRSALLRLLEDLSDEVLVAREKGAWSVADHLTHVAAWERGVAEYLLGRSRAAGMGLDEAAWELSMDEINERIYRQYAALPAAQVRQMFEDAHQQMLKALEGLDDEDLRRDYAELLPDGAQSPYAERLVIETIAANTYEHYDEHGGYIQQKLAKNQ